MEVGSWKRTSERVRAICLEPEIVGWLKLVRIGGSFDGRFAEIGIGIGAGIRVGLLAKCRNSVLGVWIGIWKWIWIWIWIGMNV